MDFYRQESRAIPNRCHAPIGPLLSGKVAAHKDASEVIVDVEMSPVFSEQTIRRKVISDIEMTSMTDGSHHQIKPIAIIELKVRNPISFDKDMLIMDFGSKETGERKNRWSFNAINATDLNAKELEVEGSFPGDVSIQASVKESVLHLVVEASRALKHGEMFRLGIKKREDGTSSKQLGSVSSVAYDSELIRVLPSAIVASETNGLWELEFRVLLPRTCAIDPKSVVIEVAINGSIIDKDCVEVSSIRERLYKVNVVRCKTSLNGPLSGIVTGRAESSDKIESFRFETTCYGSEKNN